MTSSDDEEKEDSNKSESENDKSEVRLNSLLNSNKATETDEGDQTVSVKKVCESNVLGRNVEDRRIIPRDNYQEKKEVGMECEDAIIKSILARYGPDGLVVGRAKDDPEPILKVVEEENGNPGEDFIEEELQKPSIEEEIEKPKTGNFDFTSLTGLSDDEDEVEADEKMEESTVKEVPIPNLELVKMKQEETLAEIAEQVRYGKQKFTQY